jgi:hypothetical protein
MKKRLFSFILLLMMIFMITLPALAVDDPIPAAQTAVTIDWSLILGEVLKWAVGALLGFIVLVIAYVIVRYLIPNLPGIVQWLMDKRLMWLAKILVNAAEVTLGRHMGAEKLALVKKWFEDRGIAITEDVEIMISNAWTELNNKMIELGLKEAATTES